jgi:4-carboxymuconolactone decarboxylase
MNDNRHIGALTGSERVQRLRILADSFSGQALGGGDLALEFRLRELVILHVAWITQCEDIWTPHEEIARTVGVTEAQLASIQQFRSQSFAFNEREKCLLLFLSHVEPGLTATSHDCEPMRRHFSDRTIIEILALHAFWSAVASLIHVFER